MKLPGILARLLLADLVGKGRSLLRPLAHPTPIRFLFTQSQTTAKVPLATISADYCAPPPPVEMPSTIFVPPSNWISCFAPSRMLET
jgi:hypothetical protein